MMVARQAFGTDVQPSIISFIPVRTTYKRKKLCLQSRICLAHHIDLPLENLACSFPGRGKLLGLADEKLFKFPRGLLSQGFILLKDWVETVKQKWRLCLKIIYRLVCWPDRGMLTLLQQTHSNQPLLGIRGYLKFCNDKASTRAVIMKPKTGGCYSSLATFSTNWVPAQDPFSALVYRLPPCRRLFLGSASSTAFSLPAVLTSARSEGWSSAQFIAVR